MEDFKKYLRFNGKMLQTMDRYAKTVIQLKSIQERTSVDLEEMTYNDVLSLINTRKRMNLSPSSITKELLVLSHYFNFLIVEGIRYDNPTVGVKIRGAQVERIPKLLKEDFMEQMYKDYPDTTAIKLRNKIMLGLMIYQGLKTAEISSLKPSHLNLDECTIYVSEGVKSNSRTLGLKSKQLLPLLKYTEQSREGLKDGFNTEKLFFSSEGNDLKQVFARLSKELRNKHDEFENWNQIRASVITNMVTPDTLRQTQYYFGMKKVKTAERYLRGSIEDLREELDRCFT